MECIWLQIPVTPHNEDDFMREAKIMKILKHPNIVGYFGDRLIDNCFNILIEWMPRMMLIIININKVCFVKKIFWL